MEKPELEAKSLCVPNGELKFSDAIAGLEEQTLDRGNEIKCRTPTFPESLNPDSNSPGCTTENADNLTMTSSTISVAKDSVLTNETAAGGSMMATSLTEPIGERNTNDGDVSVLSTEEIGSSQKVSLRSPRSESRESTSRENNELSDGTAHLKFVMQDKTESSSSSSTHVIIPTSSNDSCQEASGETKSPKRKNDVCFDTSEGTNLICSSVDLLEKNSGLLSTSICTTDTVSATLSTEKPRNLHPQEMLSLYRGRNFPMPHRAIANRFINVEMDDVYKSKLLKLEASDLCDQDNVEFSCNLHDAFKITTKIARDVEQGIQTCASSPVNACKSATGDLAGFVASFEENGVAKTQSDGLISHETKTSGGFCSNNELDGESQGEKKEQHLETVKPSCNVDRAMTSEDKQGSSSQITGSQDQTIDEWTTQPAAGIDLNEGGLAHEEEDKKQSVKGTSSCVYEVVKPTPVMAKTGIPVHVPTPHLCLGDGSWKGSCATSAFEPVSVSKISDAVTSTQHNDRVSTNDSHMKGIDLNIAIAEVESVLDKCFLPSCIPPAESSPEVRLSTQAERLIIDLNHDDNDIEFHQVLLSESSARHAVRDFDLNDNPASEDLCHHAEHPGEGTKAFKKLLVDDPRAPSSSNARQRESEGSASVHWPSPGAAPMHVFGNGDAQPFLVAVPNLLSEIEQMHGSIPLQDRLSNTDEQLRGWLWSETGIDPSSHLPPPIYFPSATPELTAFQQLHGSCTSVPPFSGACHFAQIHGASRPTILRPEFDLKGGRPLHHGGSTSDSELGEEMRSSQTVACCMTPTKRREPEGGWDWEQIGYRQVNSWR